MITLRIDVDYAYPSRAKSFLFTVINKRTNNHYLKNSKIIARMINESHKNVKAYWFFTPHTVPNKQLLRLLNVDRHEIALHVVNNPMKELKQLESLIQKDIKYFTIHGTSRILARIIWKRWKTKSPSIPKDFPAQSFYLLSSSPLDRICYYAQTTEQAVRIAETCISNGKVLEIHPIWLFQKGKLNHRGPFYETLRRILKVDERMETITVKKKLFFSVARDTKEYVKDVVPTDNFIGKLKEKRVDLFTFIERKWCNTISNPPSFWLKSEDNVALLRVKTYDDWWRKIGKKTRIMVRKGEKNGLKAMIAKPDEKLAEGIWKIFTETPIRQDRAFPHYRLSLQKVKNSVLSAEDCIFVGAFFQNDLVGFLQLIKGEKTAIISQILSFKKHSDKAVNNALIAKAVEICVAKELEWLMYGRIGNHPSLDRFKHNNFFSKFPIIRYYIPITKKGQIAARMGLHRDAKDLLPKYIKYPIIPLYNWINRNKMRIDMWLSS